MNRFGPVGRVLTLGLAVAAAWTALWLVRGNEETQPTDGSASPSPSGSVAGEAPQRYGSIYLCPLDAPYRAYAARGYHFYPPNHPLLPDSKERPDRCFASARDAVAAGYSAALPPIGWREVSGVYLMPASEFDPDGAFGQACLRAARHLGFAVPCPTLLPSPGLGQDPPRCGDLTSFGWTARPPCVIQQSFFFEEAGFAIPPGYGYAGAGSPRSDLVIVAFRRGQHVNPLEGLNFQCGGARTLQKLSVDRSLVRRPPIAGRLLLCPEEELFLPPLAGHLILSWAQDGIVYEVAVYGDTQTNRDLLTLIGAGIELVEPTPKRPAP